MRALDALAGARGGVAYLMYHEIELPQRELCNTDPGYVRYVVHEPTFRAHVDQLRADGLRGVSVGEALAQNGGASSLGMVVITFDDGCETDLVIATPILHAAKFSATSYVTFDHLGRRGYLTKGQLRELSDAGIEIGSHAMTHRYLHDLSDAELITEIEGSKKALEDITGKRVAHFSCPGGRWDERVLRVARQAGYDSLVTSEIGLNSARSDPFKLTRVAVMRGMDARALGRIAHGEGLARRRAQSAALNAAKRVLGNTRYERARAAALRLARR